MKAKVSLIRGDERYANVARALEQVADQVSFRGCQRALIKPNLVSTQRQLAATHVDAARAVLDFVRARYAGRLTLAEGSALSSTWEGFERYGYRELVDRYDVDLVDLNADQAVPVQVYDRRLRPQTLRLARTVVESDLRISVGPPKTHDTVIVTLSLKNMVMGSLVNRGVADCPGAGRPSWLRRLGRLLPQPLRRARLFQLIKARLPWGDRSDKMAMHQGYPVINLNLAMIAPWVAPHLAVIDGFQAMEGAGPENGDPVDWRVALAGVDPLAVDSLTARLMGFDPAEAGYLSYCQQLGLGLSQPDQIEVVGNVTPERVRHRFRPHPSYSQQRGWQSEGVARWLRPAPRAPAPPKTKRGQEL